MPKPALPFVTSLRGSMLDPLPDPIAPIIALEVVIALAVEVLSRDTGGGGGE